MIETFRIFIWILSELIALSILFFFIYQGISYLVDYPDKREEDYYKRNTTVLQRTGWALSYYFKKLRR